MAVSKRQGSFVLCGLLLAAVDFAGGVPKGDKPVTPKEPSFVIDYDNNCFSKDGKPFQIIGVAMHYYMVDPDLWESRLTAARAMGANAVSIYVPWNLHEQEQGVYNFEGIADIERLFQTAHKLGIFVALRPSPYIDSEWDAGGHPAWLFRLDPNMVLRTSKPPYMDLVKAWYEVLLPKVAPYTYQNGGPIIMTQIENEYGSWDVDKTYYAFLRDTIKQHLGPNHLLYTTDPCGDVFLQGGVLKGAFPTVDFGITTNRDDVKGKLETLRKFAPKGPFVNSEYYPGWFDVWGASGHSRGAAADVVTTIENMWAFNGSFFIYMGIGGTIMDYWAAGQGTSASEFHSVTTAYEFSSPITDSGEITPKCLAIRTAVEKHLGAPVPYPVPQTPERTAYGTVKLTKLGTILDLLPNISDPVIQKPYPVNVEQLRHYFGFILYESVAPVDGSKITLPANGIADRAYVLVNEVIVNAFQRPVSDPSTTTQIKKGDKIQILVENQGRICYYLLHDLKGLVGNVTVDDTVVTNWNHYPLNISRLTEALENPVQRGKLLQKQQERRVKEANKTIKTVRNWDFFMPSFYAGEVDLPKVTDSFLDPTNWHKGQAFINGRNIGRYWPMAGPQVTLYLAAPQLKPKTKILLFELDGPGNCDDDSQNTCSINLTDHMIYK